MEWSFWLCLLIGVISVFLAGYTVGWEQGWTKAQAAQDKVKDRQPLARLRSDH